MIRNRDIAGRSKKLQLSPEEQAEWQKLQAHQEKAQEQAASKLADHLTTFNDGVIAIIITIVVLEIQAPVADRAYGNFIEQIGIFLISFFVVADFWYEMHKNFSNFIWKANKWTMICDFCFLASLSLIPVMTKWLMDHLSMLAVVNFGIVYFFVQTFELLTERAGMRASLPHIRSLSWIMSRFARIRIVWLLLLNLLFIGISFINPRFGMVLYLAFPILNFIAPESDRGSRSKGEKNYEEE